MFDKRTFIPALGAAGFAMAAFAGSALADGEYESYNTAAAAAEEGRKLEIGATLTGTSEYVFRGVTQTAEDPTLQGSIDASYGIFYAGVWGSGLDFGDDEGAPPFFFGEDAQVEVDFYAGIKPNWGPVEFDLGVIYYVYPGAADSAGELDYVELKAGAGGNLTSQLSVGGTFYYSDDYTGELGESYVYEGTAAYELPKIWVLTPSVSGLIGYLEFDDDLLEDYTYWNAGISFAVEKLTFDFRYWDTDLAEPAGTDVFSADERFVFSATVSLP